MGVVTSSDVQLRLPQRIVVSDISDDVVISIGDFSMRMHYTDALTLAQWIRLHGRRAKRNIGQLSPELRVAARLAAA